MIRFPSTIRPYALCVCAALVPGCATSTEQGAGDQERASNEAVSIYKRGGMQGTIAAVEDCYEEADSSKFYCVYLDLAARHIDQIMVATFNYPPTEFYEDAQFGSRLGPAFAKANMSMDKSNAFLRVATPVINGYVDHAILQAN